MDRQTILVAEDEANDVFLMRQAFAKALSRAALQFVAHGEEALAYLRGKEPYANRQKFPFPAILLLDLKMPRMSGLEVLAEIRNDPGLKRLTVVILTASDKQRDVDLAVELGANSYLVKPASLDQLASVLQRVEDYWLSLNHGSPARLESGEPFS
jgi:CheY-like chemotaxis protein